MPVTARLGTWSAPDVIVWVAPEQIVPTGHNAWDVAKHLGLAVRSDAFTLHALRRRAYACLGPGAPTGTSATEVHEATITPSQREGCAGHTGRSTT